jgi:hypothetical protein
MSHQSALKGLISIHKLRRKLSHVCSDIVSYLHVHDIKIVVQPPFKDKGLALIEDLAGLAEEMYFGSAPHKMRNGKEVSI